MLRKLVTAKEGPLELRKEKGKGDVLGWGWAYFCRSCQKGVLYPSSEAKAPLGLEAAA